MNTIPPWLRPAWPCNLSAMALATSALIAATVLAAGAPAAPPAGPPTVVQGVIAPAGPQPAVTKSFPTDGGSANSGVLVLKVTFDQPMTPKSWSYGPDASGAFPNCLNEPRLLADQHTFALLCTVSPDQAYAVQINPSPAFANSGGRSASGTTIHFTTTGEVTATMHDALVAAGLTDDDEPLMSWDDAGKGVSRSGEARDAP